jgi:peptidoglycan hydrolase-like protein with peptidoglycan-binding domain
MKVNRSVKFFRSLLLGLAISSCSSMKAPEVPLSLQAQYPSSLPTSVVTDFKAALTCMDDLMAIQQVDPIYLSSSHITNFTSERSISKGSTEMLISALSKMTIRSGGVRYVSFGPDIQNILSLQGAHPDKGLFRVPDYFVRGGLTQVNKTFWTSQKGYGVSTQIDAGDLIDGGTFFLLKGQEDATQSVSQNANYGTLTMDLNAGYISTLQMIPGAVSSNTLALKNLEGKALSADLSMNDLGFSFSMSDNTTKDFNNVLRSLIEVSAIELVGKLHGVPYWRCLANAGVHAEKNAALLAEFVEKNQTEPTEIIKIIQRALVDLDYYTGTIDGQLSEATSEALSQYQTRMGLLASGSIGFDTFRSINTYTPLRDTPYVSWWENVNQLAIGSKVTPPLPQRVSAPAKPAPATGKPATTAAKGKVSGGNQADNEEILAQPSDHYTVQLLATGDVEGLEAYVHQHDLGSSMQASINAKGARWQLLLLGLYADETKANEARDLWVKTTHSSLVPWVRKLGPLQQAIRRAPAKN